MTLTAAGQRVDTKMTRRPAAVTARRLTVRFAGSFPSFDLLPRDPKPHIAVAGRSNVGKSSLLNAYFGQKNLAKVSATPGKTRSLNLFLVNDSFYLVDLPGYGYAKVAKAVKASWGPMIETYLKDEKRLVGLVLLVDCRRTVSPEDTQLLEWLRKRETPVLTIMTKADKLGHGARNVRARKLEEELGTDIIPFSAHTNLGRPELVAAISSLLRESAAVTDRTHGKK